MSWIQHPVLLEGDKVILKPLERIDFSVLQQIGANPQIWEYMSMGGNDAAEFRKYLESAVLKRASGEQYTFTVFDKASGNIIGSTMLHSIYPVYRKLEIGYTWYDPLYWRTGHNRECKLLLLAYCFEVLGAIRVQFVAGEKNHRSRTAIEGIGATLEGILRNERIRHNGEVRNTAIYSIIDSEWPAAKIAIQNSLARSH